MSRGFAGKRMGDVGNCRFAADSGLGGGRDLEKFDPSNLTGFATIINVALEKSQTRIAKS
jgi:hypothetical protein